MKTGEDRLVRKITKALAFRRLPGLPLGAGDDAALLQPRPGRQLVLTCDWFLEGSHFLRDKHPPDSIGWKCLARAVSDVAAMGGEPRYFLLSLALPETHTGKWLDGFLRGLAHAERHVQCQLAGGDTTRNHKILINVTVIGDVRTGGAVLRSGAKPGDWIFVSGRLGEAELGLRSLRGGLRVTEGNRTRWVKKHLYPEPRLALGRWLAGKRLATAMMDLSDGLSTDLTRLCAASRVGARIAIDKIPKVAVPKKKGRTVPGLTDLGLTELALHGGDDYELLFTVRPKQAGAIPSSFQGLPLSCIGEITRERQLLLTGPEGLEEQLVARGWDPF
jgi:thiamine-monophosphate kinase